MIDDERGWINDHQFGVVLHMLVRIDHSRQGRKSAALRE